MTPRVIVTFIYPPIPIRSMDWQAHYAGEEDEQMDIGEGATAEEAVVDLIENHPRGVQCERDAEASALRRGAMLDQIAEETAVDIAGRYARSCGAYSVALFLLSVDIDIALDMFTTVGQFQRKLMEMRAMIVKVEAEQDALQSGETIARGNREAA